MFHIKYSIKKSPVHGMGVFAGQNIPQGSPIYSPNLELDLLLTRVEFKLLNEEEQRLISHYGYFDKELEKYHLAHDDIRFCNHSEDGNLTLSNGVLIATQDVKIGDELTQDYSEFEENLRFK